MIRVLGFCGSPRIGNSQYLLDEALNAFCEHAKKLDVKVEVDKCTIRGKKLSGCLMCQGCMKDGVCLIKDDFATLQQQWMNADVILYSVPVYHMGIPAQMKAFFDRLGNSSFGRYKQTYGEQVVTTPKPLKVIGCISQGIHSNSGQEHTITQIINHAMISGCVPVAGDMWESYIGAGGWTLNQENRNALQEQYAKKEESARVAVDSSRSLAVRALDMAVLLQQGGLHCPKVLEDSQYIDFRERLRTSSKQEN